MSFDFPIYFICILLAFLTKFQTVRCSKSTADLLDKFQQTDYKLKFERAESVRYNKQFFKKTELTVFKYNRTTAVLNFMYFLKIDLNNETEAVAQAYKFASNEYRLFPMRMQLNVCKAVAKNTGGVGNIRNCGNFTGCPLLKNQNIFICNWAPDESQFPPFIPNGHYMLEVQFLYRTVEIFVAKLYLTVDRPIAKK